MENIDKKQTSCTEKHLRHIALSGQKRGCFCADNEGNENKNFHFHKSKNAIRKKKKFPGVVSLFGKDSFCYTVRSGARPIFNS